MSEPTARFTANADPLKPLFVPLHEARRILGGISARKLAQLVAAGELESVKIGTRRLLTQRGLEAFVAARAEGGR